VTPVNDVSCTKSESFPAFDKNRYGLNLLASLPQLESSICSNCAGTTSTAPAGMTTPLLKIKSCSQKKERERISNDVR